MRLYDKFFYILAVPLVPAIFYFELTGDYLRIFLFVGFFFTELGSRVWNRLFPVFVFCLFCYLTALLIFLTNPHLFPDFSQESISWARGELIKCCALSVILLFSVYCDIVGYKKAARKYYWSKGFDSGHFSGKHRSRENIDSEKSLCWQRLMSKEKVLK